jgi:hypothetical protein
MSYIIIEMRITERLQNIFGLDLLEAVPHA